MENTEALNPSTIYAIILLLFTIAFIFYQIGRYYYPGRKKPLSGTAISKKTGHTYTIYECKYVHNMAMICIYNHYNALWEWYPTAQFEDEEELERMVARAFGHE